MAIARNDAYSGTPAFHQSVVGVPMFIAIVIVWHTLRQNFLIIELICSIYSLIGIIAIISKESYTSRYSSGHLMPNLVMSEMNQESVGQASYSQLMKDLCPDVIIALQGPGCVPCIVFNDHTAKFQLSRHIYILSPYHSIMGMKIENSLQGFKRE